MEETASSPVGGRSGTNDGISQGTETIGLPTQPRRTDEISPNIPDYRLIKIIGQGAFGNVWLAEEPLAGLFRAIKVLDGGGRGRRARAEMTNRELGGLHKYQTLTQGHPNLIQVFKTGLCTNHPLPMGEDRGEGSSPQASVYYVMEIADHAGGAQPHRPMDYRPLTLSSLIRRHGRLPPGQVVEHGLTLLDAIEHLHKAGIHHRDIKPSNILFVGGTLKLADIGLVSDEHDEYVGTTGYLPPEGKPSDLYAFGKVLYEMVTGLPASAFPEWPKDLGPVEVKTSADSNVDDTVLTRLRERINQLCHPDVNRRIHTTSVLHGALLKLLNQVRASRLGSRKLVASVGLIGAAIGAVVFWLAMDRPLPRKQWAGQSPMNGAVFHEKMEWNDTIVSLSRHHRPGDELSLSTAANLRVVFFDLQTQLLKDGTVRVLGGFEITQHFNPVPLDTSRRGGEVDQLFLVLGEEMECIYHGEPRQHPPEDGRFDRSLSLKQVVLNAPENVNLRLGYTATRTPQEGEASFKERGTLHSEIVIAHLGCTPARIASTSPISKDWTVNPGTGHSYRLTDERTTWSEAERQAIRVGGHLVTVNDARENQWLFEAFGQVPPDGVRFFWIGLNDQQTEGSFEWATGESHSFSNWDVAFLEPKGRFEDFDFVEMATSTSDRPRGTWIVEGPTHINFGIIERP